jgi:hypothetical protein
MTNNSKSYASKHFEESIVSVLSNLISNSENIIIPQLLRQFSAVKWQNSYFKALVWTLLSELTKFLLHSPSENSLQSTDKMLTPQP